MKALNLFLLFLVWAIRPLHAQGTLMYDQESSNDEAYPTSGLPIQFYGSVGQSFTPSLSSVGFLRLKLKDINPGNALGANLVVNLRANAINGPILGTTPAVALTDGFDGSVNFFFAAPVPVVASTTYYFQTLVQSGDSWGITGVGDSYPTGVFYGGVQPFSANDLWFREGIVVPEPTTASLIILGTALGFVVRRKHTNR